MSDRVLQCDSIQPLLGDYADGEIVSGAEKVKIESHLAVCINCASEIAFLRATNFVVSSSFPDVQPPVDLFVRTARATYARPSLQARIATWLSPLPVRAGLGSAAAAALVLAIAAPVIRQQHIDATRPVVTILPAAPRSDSLATRPLTPRVATSQAGTRASAPPAVSLAHDYASNKFAANDVAPSRGDSMQGKLPSGHDGVPANSTDGNLAQNTTSNSHTRDTPQILNRVRIARLALPPIRETKLSMRGGSDFQRTLPDGNLPKEIVPEPGIASTETEAPARIAALASPAISSSGPEMSSAHTVIEPPVVPRALHISLGGAGSSRPAVIQLTTNHHTSDEVAALVTAPMDEKTDVDDSAKNASRGKIP